MELLLQDPGEQLLFGKKQTSKGCGGGESVRHGGSLEETANPHAQLPAPAYPTYRHGRPGVLDNDGVVDGTGEYK